MDESTWRLARPLIVAGLVLLGVFLLLSLAIQLRQLIAVVFLGVVVGVSLNPTVDFLARARIPSIASVLLVYAVVGGLLVAFGYYTAVEIAHEEFDLGLDTLRADYDEFRQDTPLPTSAEVEDGLRRLIGQSADGVVSGAMSVANGFVLAFTSLFTGLLFTVTQDRMRYVLLSFFPPEHRPRAEEVLKKLAVGLRGFVIGELAAMLTIGVVTYFGLLVLGVDFPLLLAFIAFLCELLPLIGPWISFVPALIVALTDSIWLAAQVAVLYLLIQSFENYLVTPLVHGQQSKVPALLILIALLAGGSLMGILGALVALPIAVSLHILFFEVVMPWNENRFRRREQAPPAEEEEAEELALQEAER